MLVVKLMQAEAALASLVPEELPALSGSGQGAEPEGRGGRGSAGAQPEQAPLQGHEGMPSKGLGMVRSSLIMVPDVLVSTSACAIAAGTLPVPPLGQACSWDLQNARFLPYTG